MTEQAKTVKVGGVVHRVGVGNTKEGLLYLCVNGLEVCYVGTVMSKGEDAVNALAAALRAATPKEPDVKQEFKPGDRAVDTRYNDPGTVVAVHEKVAWFHRDGCDWPSTVSLSSLGTLPSPPGPYEAAAAQVACKMNLRNFDRGTIADILRSHFPNHAEMRAVVEAARSCRNFMDPDDYTDLQDALDALDAKEADRG